MSSECWHGCNSYAGCCVRESFPLSLVCRKHLFPPSRFGRTPNPPHTPNGGRPYHAFLVYHTSLLWCRNALPLCKCPINAPNAHYLKLLWPEKHTNTLSFPTFLIYLSTRIQTLLIWLLLLGIIGLKSHCWSGKTLFDTFVLHMVLTTHR